MAPISTWLRFALQQTAAESYLDRFQSGELFLSQALQLGNNSQTGELFSDPTLPGKTRMTTQQAADFAINYQIVDHHASDATGFSATLTTDLSDPTGKTFTLSFRSLEYQNQVNGGDWERDGIAGAAGELSFTGFALAQLVSMERYYRELKADPNKLPPGAVLNVTGYSLGGHLATIFTELHYDDPAVAFGHTYIFNGAGRGGITGGTAGLSEAERIREMLQAAEARLTAIAASWFVTGNPANVYDDPAYKQVRADIIRGFSTTNSVVPPGQIGIGPAFDRISQIVGHGSGGLDAEFVANSGIHANPVTVLVETQPLYEGRDLQGQLQYGNSHSLTLLVDSLALQELFLKVDPTLTQSKIEDIFKAVSDQKADTTSLPGISPLAEGDTLERALDTLRRVFLVAWLIRRSGGSRVISETSRTAISFIKTFSRSRMYWGTLAIELIRWWINLPNPLP
ncbi:MAG: hypothetical protein U0231_00905 [Nitrospiraceae bacterium]